MDTCIDIPFSGKGEFLRSRFPHYENSGKQRKIANRFAVPSFFELSAMEDSATNQITLPDDLAAKQRKQPETPPARQVGLMGAFRFPCVSPDTCRINRARGAR